MGQLAQTQLGRDPSIRRNINKGNGSWFVLYKLKLILLLVVVEQIHSQILSGRDMSTTESASSVPSASAHQKNQVDLLDFIDWTGVECLNQNTAHPYPNALKQGYREDEGLNLESDADEQLLIYIPFTQVIKLHSIVIKGPEEEGPQTVKLYTNKEHMGFSNVSDYPPSDTLALTPENLKGKPVVLKYVKFQNVRSLTIFIEDNQSGSDMTKVQKIILQGMTVETTDMKGLKKIEDHH